MQVLLVEDNPAFARLLQEHLTDTKPEKFTILHVDRQQAALQILRNAVIDVVLLDLTLPDSSGLGTVQGIVAHFPDIPIVVLTSIVDDNLALEAVRQGAQDYLVKQSVGQEKNTELLVRSLRYAIERKQAAEDLRKANEALEQRVQYRTAELARTNTLLQQEILERKAIEQALILEKELAQVTVQSIGDAVIVTDRLGQITSLNPVAETLTGWTEAAAVGRALPVVLTLISNFDRLPVQNPLKTVLRSGCSSLPASHILVRNNDGQEFTVEHSAAPLRLSDGAIAGAVLVCRDITNTRNLAHQLAWQATHDPLTGLINRREFDRCLKQAVAEAQTTSQESTLCYLDLDQFKIVNDTCGHAAGDELLRQVATLLYQELRPTDLLGRLGGDEFGVLLRHSPLMEARVIANRLLESIQKFRFVWQEKPFKMGVSVGIVTIDAETESAASVLSAADAAMYAAKDRGRNRYHVYQPDDQDLAQRHGDMEWVSRLVRALENDQFCLYQQVIAPIQAQGQYHAELLLRIQGQDGRLVPPMAFIPAAERYDLMPAIDRWVVQKLFSQLGSEQSGQQRFGALSNQRFDQWAAASHPSRANRARSKRSSIEPVCAIADPSMRPTPAIYTVNLSGASLNDEQFLDFLKEQFLCHGVDPSRICFEITETVAVANLNQAAHFIQQLKQMGCYFALDDFGSGMSSLSYLKNLPVDYLKIDGHFIQNIVEDSVNAAMVKAINYIGHTMGLQTIAEFVESTAILDELRHFGVDYAQGYAIAPPQPLQWNVPSNICCPVDWRRDSKSA